MSGADTLEVKILEKDYLVACPEDKKAALRNAAGHLDAKMREIRASGKVHGTERIAVMAALNITYELMQNSENLLGNEALLKELEAKLDEALPKT